MGEQLSKFDPRWDAQTLAEAAAIEADTSRLAAAQSAAEELRKEAEAQEEKLSHIAEHTYNHPSSVRDREQRKERKQPA